MKVVNVFVHLRCDRQTSRTVDIPSAVMADSDMESVYAL